jgi:hypothetical protein
VLLLGTAPGAYTLPNVTVPPPVTYLAGDLCTSPATDTWQFPGFFYHALAAQLAPATRYYARPVVGGVPGREVTFVTGKPTGAGVATRFVMYADQCSGACGGGAGAVATGADVAAAVAGGDIDFALVVGDLGYARGAVPLWSAWMALIEPTASVVPLHVVPGNHEYDYVGDSAQDPSGAGRMFTAPWWNGGTDSSGECGVGVATRFRMPANGNGVFWYSFDVGAVHIVMLSSEHDASAGAPMGAWLAQDLAAVDRSATPWVVVALHRPLVETEAYASDYAVAAGLRGLLEPVLLRYRVDVVMAGHYHSMQRTCACANMTCVPPDGSGGHGVVHYTSGAAGASLDAITLYPSSVIDTTLLGVYGYSIVEAANASALRLTFIASLNGTVMDDVWLTKA